MIVSNLHVVRITFAPFEADAPLVIDADAMLSGPIAAQFLQPIGRRSAQIIQGDSIVDHAQFPQGDLLNVAGQL